MNINISKALRLGNFFIQINNALHIALYYNYNIILPKHEFLNTTYVIINKDVTPEAEQITNCDYFFTRNKIENVDDSIFYINSDKVLTIMKDIFVFNYISPLGNNDLLLHIRSGDIFSDNTPHPCYIMPPLSYYKNIIDQNNYDNIYLIAEDRLNPCINRLLELYPKIMFKLQPLEEDVKMVMAACNVVISYGTFIPSLLNLSNNIKNIYCPSYFVCGKVGSNTHVTDLSKYQAIMSPWKNTPDQKITLLEYTSLNI